MPEAAPPTRFQRFVQRIIRPNAPAPAVARDTVSSSPGPILGRDSYNLGGLNTSLGPYYHVPVTQNFPLYERLQEAVPLIDAAIVHTIEAIGCPCIEAEEDVKADIDDWMYNRLLVNKVQIGIGPFIEAWVGNLLTYGRSHAEITLTNRRDDIYSLTQLHPGTIAFRPSGDGVNLDTVQLGRIDPLVFPEWKVMNAVNRVRGDDPNGTSLLWGLSIVAECYIAMVRSQQGLYTRFGDPSYHINVEPPDGLNDPQGSIMRPVVQGIRTEWMNAMAARKDGKVKDAFTSGKVTATVIGAAGEELSFSQSAASMEDQIMTKTGLPPVVFGITRATTERMSSVQSGLLAEMVDRYQQILTPPLMRMITLRQQLAGKSTEFRLAWDGANLMDRLQDAQADEQEAKAHGEKWANWNMLWKTGLINTFQVAREFCPELAEMSDEEIAVILKDGEEKATRLLPDIQPSSPPAPTPFGGSPAPNTGQPAQGQGPGNNRPPAVARSLSYASHWDESNGNGNGNH